MAETNPGGDREAEGTARQAGVLANPVTGERLTFLDTGRDTGGEFTRVRLVLPPRGKGTPAHFHTALSERFEVVSGRLHVFVEVDRRAHSCWVRASAHWCLPTPSTGSVG